MEKLTITFDDTTTCAAIDAYMSPTNGGWLPASRVFAAVAQKQVDERMAKYEPHGARKTGKPQFEIGNRYRAPNGEIVKICGIERGEAWGIRPHTGGKWGYLLSQLLPGAIDDTPPSANPTGNTEGAADGVFIASPIADQSEQDASRTYSQAEINEAFRRVARKQRIPLATSLIHELAAMPVSQPVSQIELANWRARAERAEGRLKAGCKELEKELRLAPSPPLYRVVAAFGFYVIAPQPLRVEEGE